MRRVLKLVVAFVAVVVASPCLAQAPQPLRCVPRDVLERHLHDHCSELPQPPFYVLAYDHGQRSAWWQGFRWAGCGRRCDPACRAESLPDDTFELRASGLPRLTVPPGSRVATFVVGTNPLAYSVAPGESKEVTHEELPDLQRFVALLGGTVGSGLRVVGTSITTGVALSASLAGDQQALDLLAEAAPPKHALILSSVDPSTPISPAFTAWVDPVADAFTTAGSALQIALRDLATAVNGVEQQVDQMAAMERFLRAVETRAVTELRDPQLHPLPPARVSEREVHLAFVDLEARRDALSKEAPLCKEELTVLVRLIALRLAGQPAAQAEYAELTEKLTRGDLCTTLENELRDAGAWFASHPLTAPPPPPSKVELALLDSLGRQLHGYRGAVEKRQTALKEAKDLIDSRGTAGQRASYLAYVHDLLADRIRIAPVTAADRDAFVCAAVEGVLPIARGDAAEVRVPWSQVRSESFTIAFDANQKPIVAPVRASGDKRGYELVRTSPWRNIDVDLGLTHSPIVEPAYSAVSIASLGSLAPPDASDPKQLVIAETAEERRSGVPALFASWFSRPADDRALRLGGQVGFGLDVDQPALFVGPTLSIGRFLNLSGGWTFQEVDDLVDEQEEGMEVVAASDVRTKSDLEGDWYLAITLTLDNLPLFGGGKE